MDTDETTLESRSLYFGMAGNCVLGIAGVVTALLSNSQAILIDGLFSVVGFLAALVALHVNRQVRRGPDGARPLGYAMDEAIFLMFRSFCLLGLVMYAAIAAGISVLSYLQGEMPAQLNFEPIAVYMLVVLATSTGLWFLHRNAWKRGGRRSDILRIEAEAVAFDGLVTVAAGIGFAVVFLLRNTSLNFITPIGDSLIVLALCGVAIINFWGSFKAGLSQVAGITANPEIVLKAGRIVRDALKEWPGRIVDIAVLRAGRTTSVIAYLDPAKPLNAAEVDDLTAHISGPLVSEFGRSDVLVVLSLQGRSILNPEEHVA